MGMGREGGERGDMGKWVGGGGYSLPLKTESCAMSSMTLCLLYLSIMHALFILNMCTIDP